MATEGQGSVGELAQGGRMPARCQHDQFLARRSRVQEVVDSTVLSLVPVLSESFKYDPRVAELSRTIMEDPFTSPGGL